MENIKRKNCLPLAVERPAAAVFVPFGCWYYDLPSEGSLHGARIFLTLGSSYLSAREILSLRRS